MSTGFAAGAPVGGGHGAALGTGVWLAGEIVRGDYYKYAMTRYTIFYATRLLKFCAPYYT